MRDTYSSSVFHDFQYAYDSAANLTGLTDSDQAGLQNRSMTYDGLDRLLTANAPSLWGNAAFTSAAPAGAQAGVSRRPRDKA